MVAIKKAEQENPMTIDIPHLLKLSQAELNELFRKSPAGKIPDGEAEGTAIIAPGTKL